MATIRKSNETDKANYQFQLPTPHTWKACLLVFCPTLMNVLNKVAWRSLNPIQPDYVNNLIETNPFSGPILT